MATPLVGMAQESDIDTVLTGLRVAATAAQMWPVMHWQREAGPGPDVLDLAHNVFEGLVLQPGQPLTLVCTVSLPATIAATAVAGDALDVMVVSLYPTTLSLNGVSLLEEDLPMVALGPALVRVCDSLQPAAVGELRLTIQPPDNQMAPWFELVFSTPRLRERFALLDLTWARLALAAHLATTPEERRAVRDAAALVPSDLETLSTQMLSAHLRGLPAALVPIAEQMAGLRVHVIGHAHIDMNWLWTWPNTREVIKRDARSILAMMGDYPEMTFTHSQPATYMVLQQEAPDLFARVQARIQEGRWEAATMTWVEGDTNMASGEATARQLLEAVTYSREELGVQPTVFLAPDTFGHAGTLPQLAVSGGAGVYYHHRCNPGYTSPEQVLWPAYWWEGQDGTRLLAVSTPSYAGFITAGGLAEAAIAAHRQGQDHALFFHGVGDHGGGPARQSLDTLRSLQREPAFLTPYCSTIAAYARDLLQSGATLPSHHGESATVFEGCYTTQSEVKRGNRQSENALCTADTLVALAGLPYPHALGDAWHQVLFHQFHDILDGSAIHESYEQSADDYRAVQAAALSAIDAALPRLLPEAFTGEIAVTNALGWDRQDVVVVPGMLGEGTVWLRDSIGTLTPGQFTAEGLCLVATVPAFGTMGYMVDRQGGQALPPPIMAVPTVSPAATIPGSAPRPDDEAPYYQIDTPFFRVFLRRDSGILVSLYDKCAGRELVGYGMRRFSDYQETARTDLALNVLQIQDELPHDMSAWHLDEVHKESSLIHGATSRVVESGPVRLAIEVRHRVRASTITQLIAFYHDLPRVDFETTIDWHEQGSDAVGVANLKVAFTARLEDCEAWFENPFGAVRRLADGQEVPALRWADVGGPAYGMAVLNESRYGYDVLGSRLRLTLVRGAYSPDAVADQGVHTLRFSFVPHSGDWRDAGVARQSASFNQPLLARVQPVCALGVGPKPATGAWRPILSEGSVMIACLKPAHRGAGRIIRLYESAGRAVEVTLSGLSQSSAVSETTVIEDPIAILPLRGDRIDLTFRPWQVRTLLVSE